MAMKIYRIGSLTFQFEEGEQPDGAIEVVDAKPAEPEQPVEEPEKAPRKRRTAANKAKEAENK